jgi:hypothetical protein
VATLRRVLNLDALVSAVVGLALAVAPSWLLEDLLGQPPALDTAIHRLTGVALLTLALLMVLVAHRIEELWWWCWAFVVFEAGTALVTTLHGLFGLPTEAAAWPWWVLAAGSWAFAGAFLWGIARAGVEAPQPP